MDRRRRLSPSRRVAVCAGIGALITGLAACTSLTDGVGSSERSSSSGQGAARPSAAPTSSRPSGSDPAAGCPTQYARPDPKRPRVSLDFVVAGDHSTVRGTENVTFTPDKPIDELIFRLTANTVPSVQQGNKIVVTSAAAGPDGRKYAFTPANADPSTQGGLLRIPFGSTVPAGRTVTAKIAFTLTLGLDSFDRFGRAGAYAYFGSGQPLLAWERGYGWHTEDMINFTAESATSEAMDTTLRVTAPANDTVIASGNPSDPPSKSTGTRVWRAHLDAARDVSVAVGPFAVKDTMVGGVKLRVGGFTAAVRDELMPEFERAITELAKRFGPFPFPSLAVARLPAGGGGIEYPGSILMLDSSRLVAVHETAHQWFYAMVGDSQSQHPWLDEGFAVYSEELVDGVPSHSQDLDAPNDVDRSTQSYGNDSDTYYFTTYDKGGAALEAARQAAGPTKWDAALKCYTAKNAWRIANPDDLRAAIAHLPAAVAVLKKAGALR